MANTLRRTDSIAEYEVGRFLDKHFYPKHVKNLTRFDDYDNQMSGLDVQFDHGDIVQLLVDEKSAAHYVNKKLPTFAFELNFKTTAGNLVEGWLFDANKRTQYYLLIWIEATKEKGFLAEDITQLEIIIIDRKKIIDMLATFGIDKNSAADKATTIRQSGIAGLHDKDLNKPFYYYFTTHLIEMPVNIIIKKYKLMEMALAKYIIKP